MGRVRAGRYLPLLALMAVACGDDKKSDGDGGRGGMAGSSGTGGLGSLDPGGPMPNCTADEPSIVPVRERRWLAFDAREIAEGPIGRYLVEVTPDGFENLTLVAEGADKLNRGSWSADGSFLAFTRSDDTGFVSIEVLDVSQGAPPVPVEVPHEPGVVHWSPTDARFYVVSDASSDAPTLSLTDVTNGTQRIIELSGRTDYDVWSPDGRYIALSGNGVTLVDTSGAELVAIPIPNSSTGYIPLWSPGSGYVAFLSSFYTAYYDIEADAATVLSPLGSDPQWVEDGLLAWIDGPRAYVADVTQEPLRPTPLRGAQNYLGRLSPGRKCLVYDGYCGEQVSELGLCVRKLPPVSSETPVRIHDDVDIIGHWSGSGDHYAFGVPNGDGRGIVHVALDGSEFSREYILEPTRAELYEVSWNPSGESNWVLYRNDSLRGNGVEQHLWHRETRQTLPIEFGDRLSSSANWSPDGRYLAVSLWPGNLDEPETALAVQEILEDGLGSSFLLEGVFPAGDRWEAPWQP